MDSATQADGEKRVKSLLIDPLEKRGLGRPTTLTKKGYEAMLADLCARLAYMSDHTLRALEEQAAANPGGPNKDRIPIANTILTWAGQIQPPEDTASPLVRAVFAAQIGRDAIRDGWAPELLAEVKRTRRWPNAYVVSQIKTKAEDAMRELRRGEDTMARGEPLAAPAAAWRWERLAIIDKCKAIAALGEVSGGSV